jgi:anti-sigma regulatory factor (Ser/Thr protein kinase)
MPFCAGTATIRPSTCTCERRSGFELEASLIDPTTPENLGREDGRGLFLMRKLMDHVERLEAPRGSVVRMTLHRE